LFQQSLFAELKKRRARCEIFVVANGCTDQTPALAAEVLRDLMTSPLAGETTSAHVVDLAQRGKPNAWNQFVHRISHPQARCLFIMDADIIISHPATLWNMFRALLEEPNAAISVDQPQKDIALKPRKSVMDYISLATSSMTQADSAQLTGQLYCIRSEVARRIYLPLEVVVEDGFLKALVCTDCLSRPAEPQRIVQAKDAAHIFEAYTSPAAVLRNQKRQMIGQTILHLLLDNELRKVRAAGHDLASWLRERDEQDPAWLRRLVASHLQASRYFWRLFPGILTFRFRRWSRLPGAQKLRCFPAALAGFFVTLISCWMARRHLKRGYRSYWPDTRSPGLKSLKIGQATGAPPA
jgi:hypothetical protein